MKSSIERIITVKFSKEEKLTDAELDQVTGGDAMVDDSRFLHVLLQGREWKCGKYGSWTVMNHYREVMKA